MFYHRPSITPSWNQRIYPVREPHFATAPPPVGPAAAASDDSDRQAPPAASSVSRRPPFRSRATLGSDSQIPTLPDSSAAPRPAREAPPPVYYPGEEQRRQSAAARGIDDAVPRGHIASINSASTSTCVVKWLRHPAAPEATRPPDVSLVRPRRKAVNFRQDWRSWIRLPLIWRALRQDPEVLWDGWPIEFGGSKRVPWEEEAAAAGGHSGEANAAEQGTARRPRSSTARSNRRALSFDSGIGLSRISSVSSSVPLHPLEILYRRRIAELNRLISESLVVTRIWLALTELTDMIWFACLIIALASGGGAQTGFLKGVEIGLVLVILVNGLAVNGVRMRRYALATALKARSRDWSPLPITSSTNSGLMRNYLDGDADDRDRTESMQPKEGPVLRWRLRETEGGFWLGYRPIVRCEMVVPSAFSYHTLQARLEQMPVLEDSEAQAETELVDVEGRVVGDAEEAVGAAARETHPTGTRAGLPSYEEAV